jgi:AraC-like DNA-binding protein
VVDWLDKPAVPVAYAVLIEEVAATFGVGPELLARAGVDRSAFADPTARLSARQAGALLHHARELTGEPGFGYEVGLRSSLTSHGAMGFGLLTSATLREAIELGVEFSRVRLPMLQIGLVVDGDQAAVDVQQVVPVGPVRPYLFELFLVGLARMTPVLLTGRNMHDNELWFEGPEPTYFARYRDRLPPTRFDTGVNQLRFPAAFLDLRIDTANELAAREAQAQIAGELTRIGLVDDVVVRVQSLLSSGRVGYDLTSVAQAMHVSPRTLRRRLHGRGATFHTMLSDARRSEASRLLRNSVLTVEQIADQLGYADTANFCRAFKRWTGRTPREFRAESRAESFSGHVTDSSSTALG